MMQRMQTFWQSHEDSDVTNTAKKFTNGIGCEARRICRIGDPESASLSGSSRRVFDFTSGEILNTISNPKWVPKMGPIFGTHFWVPKQRTKTSGTHFRVPKTVPIFGYHDTQQWKHARVHFWTSQRSGCFGHELSLSPFRCRQHWCIAACHWHT